MRIVLLFLLFPLFSNGKVLTHHNLYHSITRYHPKLVENLLKISENEGVLQENEGSFDTKLTIKNNSRVQGYYTGDYTEALLSKPINGLNSEIYGGYKKGTQTLPSYEGNYLTGEKGRYLLGGEINLFRNSDIYKNSVKTLNSEIDINGSKILYDLQKIDILQIALYKYWEWIAKGMKMKIYKELLELAEKRQNALEIQVSHGDIPKSYIIENRQYILQRKNQFQEAYNQFVVSSNELSLYYRDSNGETIPITEENLPTKMPNIQTNINIETDFTKIQDVNPSLKLFQIEKTKLENELKIAKSTQLPKVSISGEFYKDQGNRDITKQESVAKVGVNFSMPIERRQGKGKEFQIESKKNQITQKEIMLKNTIFAQLNSIQSNVQSFSIMLKNAIEEVEIASQLVALEKESIKQGNSNFFTLNLREQSWYYAQVKTIEMQSELNKSYIAYHALLMEIDNIFKESQ